MPATSDLGHGIHAIDTGFVRPFFDASHLRGGARAGPRSWTWGRPSPCRACSTALDGLGLAREAVDYVIVTHVHLDHAGGAGEMMRLLPHAKLVVHPRGARHMIDPAKLWAGATRRLRRGGHAPQLRPARAGGPGARDRGAGRLHARARRSRPLAFLDTPGHARHHFCVWDEASRSMFTGDTFGLAYPELASARGAFVMPTTTPVQFEPEALVASIDRLVELRAAGDAAHALLARHRDRAAGGATCGARSASSRRSAAPPTASRTAPRGCARACASWCSAGSATTARRSPPNAVEELVSLDIELNAQGLEAWLDRDTRG